MTLPSEGASPGSREPSPSSLSRPVGFNPERVTVKQIVARIIAPETWECMDAWESPPEGVRRAALNSLRKADIVLKVVGAAGEVGILFALRRYIEGALDSTMTLDALRSLIAGWADEIDDAIAGETRGAETTSGSAGTVSTRAEGIAQNRAGRGRSDDG